MATKKQAEEPKSQVPSTKPEATGAVTVYDYGNAAGKGWENTDKEDFSIPFINQLQALSPECDEGDSAHIPGAKPGMFVNSVSKRLYSEMILVPCRTEHVFVEWVPRDSGGGFVGIHDRKGEVVAQARAQSTDKMRLKTEKGNDLVETFYVYAAVLDEAGATEASELVVIAFTKTKIKRYKDIMTQLRTVKGGANIPLFAHQIVMTPTREKNASGQPYSNVEFRSVVNGNVLASLLPPNNPVLEQAQAFIESLDEGAAKVNYAAAAAEGAAGAGPSDEVF